MAAEAPSVVGPRPPSLSPTDLRSLGWAALGAGAAVTALGVAGNSRVLLGAGALATVGLMALLAPELMLCILLFAGTVKATPALSGLPVDLTIVAAGGVLVAIARRAFRPGGLPRLPLAIGFAAALAALVVLSLLWSEGGAIGTDRAFRFETLTIIGFVGPLFLLRSRTELRRFAMAVVVIALIVALTAVETNHPSEPLVAAGSDEITLAIGAAVGLFAAVYLTLIGHGVWRAVWLVPVVAVFVPTILAAGSRGVVTGSALAGLTLAVLLVARARNKAAALAFVVLAVVALAATAPGLAGDKAGEKYARVLTGGGDALGVRPRLIQQGIDLAVAHPMGIGVGGYTHETGFVYPHNSLVEVAAEQGLIALALFVALIVACARALRGARGGISAPEGLLATTLFVLLVTESMFSNTYTVDRFFWFALGLAVAVPQIVAPIRNPRTRPAGVVG